MCFSFHAFLIYASIVAKNSTVVNIKIENFTIFMEKNTRQFDKRRQA